MQETWIQSLGWEDPLEEEMANYFSIFAWQIPWTEEPGGLQPMGYQRVGHDWWLSMDACTRQVGPMISGVPVLPRWYGLFLHRGCTDIICCVFLFLAIVGYVAVGIIGKRRRGWGGGSWVCGQPTASGAEGELVVESHHLNIPGSLHSLDSWRPSKGNLPHWQPRPILRAEGHEEWVSVAPWGLLGLEGASSVLGEGSRLPSPPSIH